MQVSSASSTCSTASRHVAHGEEASTEASASSPPRASVWGVIAGVFYLAGRGVWVIMCLGLHLLSLTILAAGLFIVVRQRQLVAVV
jgi:Flp pilus assembly protein TadB